MADAAAAAQRVLGRGEGGHVETVTVQVVVAVRVVVVGPRARVRVVQTSRSTVSRAAIASERRVVHKMIFVITIAHDHEPVAQECSKHYSRCFYVR